MEIFIEPSRDRWADLARRVQRADNEVGSTVRDILEAVREGGDNSLRDIIIKVEGAVPESLKVSEEEFAEAERRVASDLKEAIKTAYSRIKTFHEKEVPQEVVWDDGNGIVCRRRFLPIRRVGLYIPGGSAPLFSTILMLGIPSLIAGCRERIICTPAAKDGSIAPSILYTAALCGIKDIYKIGGAQAIAAMAYGTQSIRKVDKIFGPGNRYVLKAKGIVSQDGIAIDMPAGPSEVLVVADGSAKVPFIAADLLSQAEHGPDSQVILVCPDEGMARAVCCEVESQAERLPRKSVVEKALVESRIIVLKDPADRMDFANFYAPEHLILSVDNPEAEALKVRSAGSVFLGNHSPESAGDYSSGTNHTLPTMGMAAAWSGIGVESFMHAVSFQSLSKSGLERLGDTIMTMAEAEGLQAHAQAVRIRLDNNG
ncbi:MAG: histidinol dehydrogenase [Bacteroidales bacterium]|nr:histidinol dehydrogenase [Bacteroidales bacterium]